MEKPKKSNISDKKVLNNLETTKEKLSQNKVITYIVITFIVIGGLAKFIKDWEVIRDSVSAHFTFDNTVSFNDTTKFNILILPFKKLQDQKDNDARFEEALEGRFTSLKNENKINLEVIYENSDKIIDEFDSAKAIGLNRKADLVIFGDYYEAKENYDVNIKYIYITYSTYVHNNLLNSNTLKENAIVNDDSSYEQIPLTIYYDGGPLGFNRISDISKGKIQNNIERMIFIALALESYNKNDIYNSLNIVSKIKNNSNDETFEIFNFELMCAYKNNNYESLIDKYTKSISQDSTQTSFYFARGELYFFKKEYDKALNDYSKAYNLDSNFITLSLVKGFAFLNKYYLEPTIENKYNLDSAENYLLKYLNNDNLNTEGLYEALINCYISKNNYVKALNVIQLAQNINYASSALLYYKGGIKARTNELDSAIIAFSYAIDLASDGWYPIEYIYMERATTYMRIKRYTEAIKDFKKLNNSDSKFYIIANVNEGRCFYHLEDYDSSYFCINRIISLDSLNPILYDYRAQALMGLENFRYAIEDFNKAISLDSMNGKLYVSRANAYVRINNFNQAFLDLEKAEKLVPYSADIYRVKADAFATIGNYDYAKINFEKAIKLNNDLKDEILPKIQFLEKNKK